MPMRLLMLPLILALLSAPDATRSLRAEPAANLLQNPGFEDDLAPAWQKRTPDDKQRRIDRRQDDARSGRSCLMLENLQATATRLRQGHNRTLVIAPGSLVEVSAWIKSELDNGGWASVQLYCMGDNEAILAQPVARAPSQRGSWQQTRLLAQVPDGARYCMVYVQIQAGTGKALFDDVQLRVVREPRDQPPPPKVALLTDLDPNDECYKNLHRLLGPGVVVVEQDRLDRALPECQGAVVLLRSGSLSTAALESLIRFADRGGRVFCDLRALAKCRNWPTTSVQIVPPPQGAQKPSVAEKMAAGLRVVKPSLITAGFQTGQTVPFAGADGKLLALARNPADANLEVLAVTPAGNPGLLRIASGKGQMVAADVLSLSEPYYSQVHGYYKYLFLANTLAPDQSLMLAEYYPRKLSYAEFVVAMRETAARFPSIRFREEGPACGEYKICSLNLGREGAPLYFLYAATHGSEWEPGYGLLTLAKRIAEGRLRDVIDLDKMSIKIVPILNPSGYDLRQRQNANGVDLNRQGDYGWNEFQGKDSNGDGKYGPRDYDWKGAAPLAEPEAKTYQRIVQAKNLHCLLDFHGNGSSKSNKVGVLPATAKEDNNFRACEMQWLANQRLRGRYVLQQQDEEACSPYLLDRVYPGGQTPFLMNTGARDRYGLLVELTAGYADSYASVLQTEVTCTVCRALFEAFPPP